MGKWLASVLHGVLTNVLAVGVLATAARAWGGVQNIEVEQILRATQLAAATAAITALLATDAWLGFSRACDDLTEANPEAKAGRWTPRSFRERATRIYPGLTPAYLVGEFAAMGYLRLRRPRR
jgi:hypothetical protein